jgi:ABC-2 type transport system permease protein
MFKKMFLFEWRYFTRQASFYVISMLFFIVPFLLISINKVGMGGGNILKNGPYSILLLMLVMSIFSMFLVVNFIANTAMRDKASEMTEIVYSKPIDPLKYQLGRFLGSFAVVVTVYFAVVLGLFIGSLMPWVDSSRIGPIHLSYYLLGFIYYILPSLFLMSCLFYSLAIRFKTMMAVYLAVTALFILYQFTGAPSTPDMRHIVALLDPFALSTFTEISRYWSISEKNSIPISLTDLLLQNRLLWLFIGLTIVVIFGRFNRLMTTNQKISKRQKRKMEKTAMIADKDSIRESEILTSNNINYKPQGSGQWLHFITRVKFEFKAVLFSPAFFILNLLTVLILLLVVTQPQGMFGTSFLPFTQNMVDYIRNGISMMIMIVITYYSAEVVWREKTNGIGEIVDSLPVSNFNLWFAKLTAVWSVIIMLLIVSSLVTISVQLYKGFLHIDPTQYIISLLFFSALPWMMFTVLAFLLQVISPNKYIGMFLLVLVIGSGFILTPIGLEHNMFQFAKSPALQYSDINGYGWMLESQTWYMLYWGALTLIFAIFSYVLWQRGPLQKLKTRFKLINYQLGKKGKIILASSLLVFILVAVNIIYNTRYLNNYTNTEDGIIAAANYEKQFYEFVDTPAPVFTSINTSVDIYPNQRKIETDTAFEILNQSDQLISRFLVMMPADSVYEIDIDNGSLNPDKGALSTHWFEFSKPMQPGESRTGNMKVSKQRNGFVDNNADVTLVKNGTFLNSTEILPMFGYVSFAELSDKNDRKRHGLSEPHRANKREDDAYHHQSIMGHMSGYINFEATLSTSLDQIAIAPGYLQKQWSKEGRSYFHYKMDAPIDNYFSIMSSNLAVQKQVHNGIDYEVYYHPNHDMNVPIMMDAMKDSIEYFSENFGPYQHRQARIIEFPGYRAFAQSFPNTIAYSEKIGFINDTSDPDEINSVYYVTAHEMAHQWWGGQVDGANVQGSTMISETMAQYSALILTLKKLGIDKIRGILKFELDRYLSERSRELIEELPLARVENQQYIHYRKGSVVMMSLLDKLGEQRLNKAFAAFIKKYKFSQKSYPLTTDLLDFINQDTTTKEKAFIHNAFEEIYLYNLIAKEGQIKETKDGQFEITFIINAKQIKADGQGIETETELSEMIEIGLFSDDPDDLSIKQTPVYFEKHLIISGENIIKIKVSKRPEFAAIDPYIKFIDRDTGDNVVSF